MNRVVRGAHCAGHGPIEKLRLFRSIVRRVVLYLAGMTMSQKLDSKPGLKLPREVVADDRKLAMASAGLN